MGPAHFLLRLLKIQKTHAEMGIRELSARARDNWRRFVRMASRIADCHLITAEPFIYQAHDQKVEPYQWASVGGYTVGLTIAVFLSWGANPSIWMATGTVAVFLSLGWACEAVLRAISDQRFFARADRWFMTAFWSAAVSLAVLVLARVATEAIAGLLEPIEPISWIALESSLLAIGAIGRAAAWRFAWSRRHVALHRQIEAEMRVIAGRHDIPVPDFADTPLDESEPAGPTDKR